MIIRITIAVAVLSCGPLMGQSAVHQDVDRSVNRALEQSVDRTYLPSPDSISPLYARTRAQSVSSHNATTRMAQSTTRTETRQRVRSSAMDQFAADQAAANPAPESRHRTANLSTSPPAELASDSDSDDWSSIDHEHPFSLASSALAPAPTKATSKRRTGSAIRQFGPQTQHQEQSWRVLHSSGERTAP